MASPTLTVRNLTTTPLELTRVEYLPASMTGILSMVKGLFSKRSLTPTGTQAVTDARIDPFACHKTNIPAPAARSPTAVRLTFAEPNAAGDDVRYTYEVQVCGSCWHPQGNASRMTQLARNAGTAVAATTTTTDDHGSKPPATDADAHDREHHLASIYLPDTATLAIYHFYHGSDDATPDDSPSSPTAPTPTSTIPRLNSWMAGLSDGLPLSVLSIPGTHNSPTYHVALPSVRCQTVDVATQLAHGVRFLDVRVRVGALPPATTPGEADAARTAPPAELTLVHGAFPVRLAGGSYLVADVLEPIYGFLDANPSETVLLSLKREGTGPGTDAQLAWALVPQLDKVDGRARPRWYTEGQIPTLGEARGKIVLVRRFGLGNDEAVRAARPAWGIDASVWPDNVEDGMAGGGIIRLQDFYTVTQTSMIPRKTAAACALMERAAQELYGPNAVANPPLFINFLSASHFFNPLCWPYHIAAKVNLEIVKFLCSRMGAGSTGIVVTDWVGIRGDWDLIRCIVGWNAKLKSPSEEIAKH